MLLVQVQLFGTGTRYGLEILRKSIKEFKLKVREFWGIIPTFVEVIREKLVGAPPILNMVKVKRAQEARVNQFLFQNVSNNEIFEISKMFKTQSLN